MELNDTQSLTNENKIKFIEMAVNKYYLESRNPLLNLFKRILGSPITKKEFKKELIKKYIVEIKNEN